MGEIIQNDLISLDVRPEFRSEHPGPAAGAATGCAGRGRCTAEIRAGQRWRAGRLPGEEEGQEGKRSTSTCILPEWFEIRTRNLHMRSCKRVSQEVALAMAPRMKAEELGIEK